MKPSGASRRPPRQTAGLAAAMLIGQASINLSANILSALLGLLSVFIFTRLFSPHDYGIYLLGVGFASVISVFLVGWFRNLILSGHARNDGTDVRGLVISGYLICCLTAPIAYGLGRLVGLDAVGGAGRGRACGRDRPVRTDPGSGSRAADGAHGHEGHAGSRRRGCLASASSSPCFSPTGFLLLLSSALAYLLAVLVQSRTAWRGTVVNFDRAGLAAVAQTGPAADAVADLARDLQRHRPLHDRQPRRRGRRRQIYRRARPGPADPDDAGDERRRGVLSARRADPRQAGRRGGAVASRRMRRTAAQHHAAGLPGLRRHFPACRQCRARRRFPRSGRRRPCRSWRSR